MTLTVTTTITTVEQVLDQKGHAVWTVRPDDSVLHTLEEMALHDVGAVVVAEQGHPVGIFSERNYARSIFLKGRSSPTIQVRDVMQRNVIYVRLDQTTDQCLAIMTEKRVRHLPVLADGKLVGLISIGDLVKSKIDLQEFIIDELVNYIGGKTR